MGLQHDFMCFEIKKVSYLECTDYDYITNLAKNSFIDNYTYSILRIHDDIIRYMYKNLAWVPCIYLSGKKYKKGIGLNPNGRQIIDQEGGPTLKKIVSLWSELFLLSTETFKIRRGYYISNKDENFPGEPCEYIICRDDLINTLQTLEQFIDLTISGSHYILYQGI